MDFCSITLQNIWTDALIRVSTVPWSVLGFILYRASKVTDCLIAYHLLEKCHHFLLAQNLPKAPCFFLWNLIQHVFLPIRTPLPKRTRFLASPSQEVQNRGTCWWRSGLRFNRAGMDSQGYTAWLFLVISRQKPQNALFPPWLEIPVRASLMYGFDGVNSVFWASRQTHWLLSEDPEHKWGRRNLSGNHSSSFPCHVQH